MLEIPPHRPARHARLFELLRLRNMAEKARARDAAPDRQVTANTEPEIGADVLAAMAASLQPRAQG